MDCKDAPNNLRKLLRLSTARSPPRFPISTQSHSRRLAPPTPFHSPATNTHPNAPRSAPLNPTRFQASPLSKIHPGNISALQPCPVRDPPTKFPNPAAPPPNAIKWSLPARVYEDW